MRVALIDPSLFTLPYDRMLALGLQSQGHEVALYARNPGPEDGTAEGVRIVPAFYPLAAAPAAGALPAPLRLGLKGVDHLLSMARLRRRLARAEERPDVIHFMWLPLPLADRHFLAGFRAIAPLVLTLHDTEPFNGDASAGLQRLGAAACHGAFDRLVVHTAQGRERLLARGVPAECVAQIPHGPLHPASPGTAAAPPDDPMRGSVTFLLFGKIKHYKGADLLIEAFARLPPVLREQARLRVVGKPYLDLEPLRELASARGVADRLEIEPRFVPDAEIPSLLGPGTVAVFPYREIEASGVLALATAAGRPIIASRLGAFAETLEDGVHGRLVPPGDTEALSEAMARMLRDRDFAARCATAMRALSAVQPSGEEVGRMTAAVYAAALEAHRRRIRAAA